MVTQERPSERTGAREKGDGVFFFVLKVLGPLVPSNTPRRLVGDASPPALVPVFVEGGPGAKVKPRSRPEMTLRPPAVISRTV